jgi:restriction system protein
MLKMAQNSLFSILLRSPWWISFAIGLAFVLLSKVVLPDNLWVYGAFGSLAFFVIGGMAFVKQWHLPSQKTVEATAAKVGEMSWKTFSDSLESAFIKDGYEVKKIDGPADFLIIKAGRIGIVSAKRWKAAQHSEESLQALYAARDNYDARDCTLVALGQLSEKASAFAKARNVQIMQGAGLAQLFKD